MNGQRHAPHGSFYAFITVCLIFLNMLSPPLSNAHAEPLLAPINAQQITSFDLRHPNKKRFGQLEFIGGLVITSALSHVGALSGMRIRGQNLTAITDTGFWFQGTLSYDKKGAPLSINNAQMSPILNEQGRPFINKWSSDIESLTFVGEQIYLSTEMDARVMRVRPKPDLFSSQTERVTAPFYDNPYRSSFAFEAIATLPKSHPQADGLLVLSEATLNKQGHIRGFILHDNQIQPLLVKRRDRYSITDADFLPNGDLLILERRFTIAKGAQMRLRQISSASIKSGALLDGTIMLDVGNDHQIDNMEGLSIFTDAKGQTRIAVVSDNNHWLLQRTLYLEFKLL